MEYLERQGKVVRERRENVTLWRKATRGSEAVDSN
jgi:hypothetical protein